MIAVLKTIWKIFLGILLAILLVLLIACGSLDFYITIRDNMPTDHKVESTCSQPGSYFMKGEERFVLVDEATQKIGNEECNCKVFADKYMLTMYLLIEKGYGATKTSTMTQIFYEDGSPMIYDDETLLEELYKEGQEVK